MVCSLSTSWILPFQFSDFEGFLTQQQYEGALNSASARALYLMSIPYGCSVMDTWGINADELNNDYSGQLQVSYEKLLSAEFLDKNIGAYKQANLSGSYTSPTGESISKDPNSLDYLANLSKKLREEAYSLAYDWIDSRYKDVEVNLSTQPYNWKHIETYTLNNENINTLWGLNSGNNLYIEDI